MSRVLIVASRDESREAALVIGEELRSNGYAVDFSNTGKDSKIDADRAMLPELPLVDYKGIVFLDDGGDPEAAVAVAKKAHDGGMVLGGFGAGCEVLGGAKILKDQFVPNDIAKQFDGKGVNAPAARSGDVVSAVGSCPMGFVMLLVDALGGEIKHIVTSEQSPEAMVITDDPWDSFWSLAPALAERDTRFMVAKWKDIDLSIGQVSGVAVGRDAKAIKCKVPRTFWVQQDGITPEQIKSLEALGCSGVSPADAVKKASSAVDVFDALALAFSQVKPIPSSSVMASDAMSGAYDVLSATGHRISRIIGKGEYAIISRNGQNLICSHEDVSKAISEGALVKVVESVATLTGKDLEFGFMMLRLEDGWKRVASAAFAGADSYPVAQAAIMGLGSHEVVEDLRKISVAACEAIERAMPGIRDLGIFVSATDSGPSVRAEANPILSRFVPKSDLRKIALMMGMEIGHHAEEPANIGHVSDAVARPWERARVHKALLEREMAREGIWLQPDSSVIIDAIGETKRLSLQEAIEFSAQAAIKMLNREVRCSGCSQSELRRARMGSLRARHRLMLLLSYAKAKSMQRTAGIYGTSMSGPFVNVELPWSERVMEWREGDDWLVDRDKSISSLPRYNPEYERVSDNDEFGIYYRWDDMRREPYYWIRRFTEGIYPMRNMLQNNPRGN